MDFIAEAERTRDGYLVSLQTFCLEGRSGVDARLMFAPGECRAYVSAQYQTFQYCLPSFSEEQKEEKEGEGRLLFTRESAPRRKLGAAELLSHSQNEGVDNTGNVRVWPSEEILLHALLSVFEGRELLAGGVEQEQDWVGRVSALRREGVRLLELGGGMTGLLGMGLATFCEEVLLTDGNEHCVRNLAVCVEMNRVEGVAGAEGVSARLLRWSTAPSELEDCLSSPPNLVVASDCLFFEDFHSDLIRLLAFLLGDRRHGAAARCALFLQPERGGSLSRFLQRLEDEAPSLAYERYDLFSELVREKFEGVEEAFRRTHQPVLVAIHPV